MRFKSFAKFLLFANFIWVGSQAWADADEESQSQKDLPGLADIPTAHPLSDRIDPLAKYLMTGQIVIGTPGFSLDLQNKDQTKKVSFAPNLATTIGVGLSFKDYLGATISFHGSPQTDSNSRGSTSYDDFHFDFDFKNFLIEAQYQRYKGLYVSNTSEVDSTLTHNLLEPDMSMQNIFLAYTYVFSPKNFSIQAALSRTERQLQSGGSWLIGSAASMTTIENGSGLIPLADQSLFGEDQAITKNRSRTLMLTGGYGYTIAWYPKLFTTLLALYGLGWGDSSFSSSSGTNNLNYLANTYSVKLVVAYSGDLFIIGFSSETENVMSQTNSIRINSTPTLGQIFIGTRY